jgi:hypothetical protein
MVGDDTDMGFVLGLSIETQGCSDFAFGEHAWYIDPTEMWCAREVNSEALSIV